MLKFKKFSALTVMCIIGTATFGQTQDSYDYKSEFTWGINKNTYSGLIGGIFLKQAYKTRGSEEGAAKSTRRTDKWKSDDRTLVTYGIELINVKNPQESRVTAGSGNQFILGKTNYLYAIRPQFGVDRILFKKAPQQGAEIKAVFAVGPTFGLLVPYYVQLAGKGDIATYAKYTPSVNISEISGAGRPFQGLSEAKVKLGLNLKAALNFEIGSVKSQVTGFEAGFLLDTYSSRIEMVPGAKNYSVYPAFFMAIFYGSRK